MERISIFLMGLLVGVAVWGGVDLATRQIPSPGLRSCQESQSVILRRFQVLIETTKQWEKNAKESMRAFDGMAEANRKNEEIIRRYRAMVERCYGGGSK